MRGISVCILVFRSLNVHIMWGDTEFLHTHPNGWKLCIPSKLAHGTLSVGQGVCICTKKTHLKWQTKMHDACGRQLTQLAYRLGMKPKLYTLPQPMFELWGDMPSDISSHVLFFLDWPSLAAMCSVALKYTNLCTDQLKRFDTSFKNVMTLNKAVILHQRCLDDLLVLHLHRRVTDAMNAFS
jgi:hypothetical protein